jgi:hypothetical protein
MLPSLSGAAFPILFRDMSCFLTGTVTFLSEKSKRVVKKSSKRRFLVVKATSAKTL